MSVFYPYLAGDVVTMKEGLVKRNNLEVVVGKDGKIEFVKAGGALLPFDEARRRGLVGPITDGQLGYTEGAATRLGSTRTYRLA